MEVIAEFDQYQAGLEPVFARVAGRFAQAGLLRRMRNHVRGPLAPVERRNGWQLAERAGHRDPAGLQHLPNGARWEADAVREDVRNHVVERLGPGGVLIIDDTGFIKKDTTSASASKTVSRTVGRRLCRVWGGRTV